MVYGVWCMGEWVCLEERGSWAVHEDMHEILNWATLRNSAEYDDL